MAGKKTSSLDRLLGRLDRLDSVNLNNLVQRLARERGLFETVFNTIQEGILVINSDGEVEYGNEAAGRLIGLRESELVGATLWRLVPGLRASLEDSLRDPEQSPVVAREIELTYPQPRFVRLYLVPFAGEGSLAGQHFAVILTGITKDQLTAEELIENERVNSIVLLAAGVAHESGTPLNSLTIHLQLIERKLKKLKSSKDTESVAESIRVCEEEVKRLDGIIRNFLEAIRPRPPNLADTNLVEVLAEVLRFQTQELDNRGIRVEVDTPSSFPILFAHRAQLKQVFFNLIKNAMEAMQPGGKLHIKSQADDESIYLRFCATGSGIRQEDLARIFEPYHTTKQNGHGLGLMIVQRIMREHGGQVGVESKEGVGTSITLQFPQKMRRARMLKSSAFPLT